jgi:hypothetical protein
MAGDRRHLDRILQRIQTIDHQFTYSRDTMSNIDPIEFGRMQSDVHMLKNEMGEVRRDVKELLEMANKGQGGLWMFRSMYVAAGGLLAWLIPQLFDRIKP